MTFFLRGFPPLPQSMIAMVSSWLCWTHTDCGFSQSQLSVNRKHLMLPASLVLFASRLTPLLFTLQKSQTVILWTSSRISRCFLKATGWVVTHFYGSEVKLSIPAHKLWTSTAHSKAQPCSGFYRPSGSSAPELPAHEGREMLLCRASEARIY